MEHTRSLSVMIDGVEIPIHAVTSDTHFGHKNIAKFTGRPFDNEQSTYQMDEALIANWNEVVEPGETVLHLGDVALGKTDETLKSVARCNGTKILGVGNHDQISFRVSANRQERFRPFYEEVFEHILPETGVILKAVRDGEVRLLRACHYPSAEDSHDRNEGREVKRDAYAAYRPDPTELPIIHGHTHSKLATQPEFPRELHVGVEAHGLAPVRADAIVDWVFSL